MDGWMDRWWMVGSWMNRRMVDGWIEEGWWIVG